MNTYPEIKSEDELDEILTRPSEPLIDFVPHLSSPLVVLGASGKMGPSLCVLAKRAAEAANHRLEVVAVSRFSDRRSQLWLENRGVKTISCDLLEAQSIAELPDSANVVYLVGLKFGTQQNPSLTWAVNTLAPANAAQRYPKARMVALSTGNVYPFVPAQGGGATEQESPAPVGEYAGSALARERIFEHFSHRQGSATVILRLNYAVELRYGVLLDIAQKVWSGQPVDLRMGYLNCVWQADANEMILRSFPLATSPPAVMNLTGSSTLSVRSLAVQLGKIMQREPHFTGTEAPTALLSNSSRLCSILGPPPTSLDQVLLWTARWVMEDGSTLGKPTHFEARTGAF